MMSDLEKSEKVVENSENSVALDKAVVDDIDRAIELDSKKSEELSDDNDEKTDDEEEENIEESDDNVEVDEDSEDIEEDDSEDDTVSDEMLEKAINLGIPIAEARKLGSDLLSKKLKGLEEDKSKVDDSKSSSSIDELLDSVPDLDPEEFEEDLINGFKSLKDIIREQAATISALSGKTKDSEFDNQINNSDEVVTKILKESPDKKAQLKEKVDILTSGYEAVGKDVDRDAIFKEAVSSVLSEDIAKASNDAKKAKAAKREKQLISRTSGKKGEAKGDVFDDIGKELDSIFFNK
jgi:hypothetical protein